MKTHTEFLARALASVANAANMMRLATERMAMQRAPHHEVAAMALVDAGEALAYAEQHVRLVMDGQAIEALARNVAEARAATGPDADAPTPQE